MLSPVYHQSRGATAPTPTARTDGRDAAWLASLAIVRRRVVYLLCSSLGLLAVGGDLLSAAHARLGSAAPAWPLCVLGALAGVAGLAAFGMMIHVARDLG